MSTVPLFPKVPSGIPGLDAIIGGGYTKNSIITLSGGTGSGRTTFATQFLVNGYRDNEEPGLFISFDEPKFSIFANMASYGWDLPELDREKHVVFIEYPYHELANFQEQENSLLELIDTLGVERVVYDTIGPLASLSNGEDERIRDLRHLISIIRRWGTTAMITADSLQHAPEEMPRTSCNIESLTDAFIHLDLKKEKEARVRTLEVVKMRGSAHEHIIYPAEITSDGFRVGFPSDKTAAGKGAKKNQPENRKKILKQQAPPAQKKPPEVVEKINIPPSNDAARAQAQRLAVLEELRRLQKQGMERKAQEAGNANNAAAAALQKNGESAAGTAQKNLVAPPKRFIGLKKPGEEEK